VATSFFPELYLMQVIQKMEQTYSSWGVTYGSQYICALKGSTVRMSCMYRHPSQEGNIKISVTQTFWFAKTDEGPVDVKTQEEYADRLEYSSSKKNCTLTIRDVKESDSAVYKFRFITSRSGGSYTGEPGVVLIVTDSDPNLTVRKKSSSWNSNLICSSSCVLPDHSTYVWYKNGKDMEIGTYVYNTWVDSDDTLSCALKGLSITKDVINYLSLAYAPVLTSVSADPSDGIVEGNRVFLKCSSDANPPANYTWYKKTKIKDSEFYLNPIQASDSGEYFCVAKNQLGESRSGNLNIDVKYAPKRADVSLSHAEIVEGDSVNLTCSSDGNPAPFNRWYKDNQMMLQGQGGVYQFTSVKSEDSGTYCCEVGNIYGQINSSTVLIN
uniref:Ig-like domain-containing protein n=1 Tax=Poecilia formosa TaxID=48698 RepID=A0A096M7I1_POEFO